MKLDSIIGVPSETPVQTLNIPIPTGGTELVLLAVFALSEALPFLGGRFKKYNGVIQGISRLISMLKPFRREDEAVAKLKEEILELQEALKRPHPSDLIR